MIALFGFVLLAQANPTFAPPPGRVSTTYIGNSFPGIGPNGEGEWVQNGADEIEVTPDGTIIAGVGWDEAGRCVGLYREGRTNRTLLKASPELHNSAWGWGTGNNAVAAHGDTIWVATLGQRLLRFRWRPGDLESAQFVEATELPDKAIALAADARGVAILFEPALREPRPNPAPPRSLAVYQIAAKALSRPVPLPEANDLAFDGEGRLWVLAGRRVSAFGAEGGRREFLVGERPTAIALSPRGELVVCDDGPDQQVKVYGLDGRLRRRFGAAGGLRASVPGEVKPDKLFALVGANYDAQGRLHVAMSFQPDALGDPNGNLILRTFEPNGKLRHELYNFAFVDTFGFDPGSDGTRIFSRTALFDLDWGKPVGRQATLRAITLDPLERNDPRYRFGATVVPRRIDGRTWLYARGQYAGGYTVYEVGPRGFLAGKRADPPRIEGEAWGWHVESNGAVWVSDIPGTREIRRVPLARFDGLGRPEYDWNQPEKWPYDDDWEVVRRVIYDEERDRLYLSGYLKGQRIESWGLTGPTLRRYDGWRKGERRVAWTNPSLPRDGNSDPNEGPLSPKSLAFAGEYLFAGMVKPTQGKQMVHVLSASDGQYVGTLTPGPEVGEVGWLDMPYAVQAMRRRNGEYLILVEEDYRGKNLVYRWLPPGTDAAGRR